MSNPSCLTAIVTHENRPEHEIGLKLLAYSLEMNNQEVDVHVFAPNATSGFQDWIGNRRAHLHLELPTETRGWNTKPDLLVWALENGYSRAVWMDHDIIVAQPLPKLLLEEPNGVLIASELAGRSGVTTCQNTTSWGLNPDPNRYSWGIRRPSNCCSRATKSHLPLIHRWQAMLRDPEYQHWQTRPAYERPAHFYGDDSIFTALIGSKECEQIPIKLLKCGRDIAQCLTPRGYSVSERLRSLVDGLPPLIHAQGVKPWLARGSERFYQSVSPYACVARRYQDILDETERDWLELPENWVKLWHDIVKGHPALSGLPFALQSSVQNIGIRSSLKKIKNKITPNQSN